MKKFYLPATVLVCIVACLAGRNDLSTLIQQGIAIGLVAYVPKKVPEIEDKVLVSDQGSWVAFSIVAFLYILFSCVMPFAPMTNGALPDGILAVPAYFIRAIYCAVVVYYVFGWTRETVRQAGVIKSRVSAADNAPEARGWASDWEQQQRFNIPPKNGTWTPQHINGIHIGNGIHWNELGHMLTTGGAGMGKGTCLVLPALLSDGLVRAGISVVCLDPKGENAAISARHLERNGYEVHIIDPFNIKELNGFKKSRWHPFDLIEDGDKSFGDMLAFSLHNRTSKGDNEFFNSRCRQYISLYVRYVLHYNRHTANATPLITQIYNLLMLSGEKREKLLSEMATDETFAGKANAEAILGRLMGAAAKTEDSIFTTIHEAIDILEDERIQDSMSYDDLDLRQLAKKPMAVFICIPHHQLRKYSAWIRIFTDSLLNTLNQHYSMKRKVLVLLDEFAQLGYVHQFSFAPAVLRGYNVTIWPIIQYLGQLADLYGADNFQTFIANSVVKHWFGGNGTTMDNPTSNYIAHRMPLTNDIFTAPDGYSTVTRRPLLNPQEIISYKKIIGEVERLPAPIEIEKIPYWKLPFCKNNAAENPMYKQ